MNPLSYIGDEFRRDEGILTQEEVLWVEREIITAIKPQLVARKFMKTRPLDNAGRMWIKKYVQSEMSEGALSMYGDNQADDLIIFEAGDVIPIPTISKTFKLRWRDNLASRNMGSPLDVQYPIEAGWQCQKVEDKLCLTGEYTGWDAMGIAGLSTIFGRQVQVSAGAWPGNAIADIRGARALLKNIGLTGNQPFLLICTPTFRERLTSPMANTEITYEMFLLKNNIISGIIESPFLYTADGLQDSALLTVPDPMNFELIEAMPLRVGWWEYKDGNMYGRVRECVVPMIKRPTTIVEIDGLT